MCLSKSSAFLSPAVSGSGHRPLLWPIIALCVGQRWTPPQHGAKWRKNSRFGRRRERVNDRHTYKKILVLVIMCYCSGSARDKIQKTEKSRIIDPLWSELARLLHTADGVHPRLLTSLLNSGHYASLQEAVKNPPRAQVFANNQFLTLIIHLDFRRSRAESIAQRFQDSAVASSKTRRV